MKFGAKMLVGMFVAATIFGCTNSTAVSTQPSQSEIQEGVNRRLAAVDQQAGLTPEMKERMKAQIRGSQPDPNRK
jgi:hypothetical protein